MNDGFVIVIIVSDKNTIGLLREPLLQAFAALN